MKRDRSTIEKLSEQMEIGQCFPVQTGECLKMQRADRLYENMNIRGVQGLMEAQKTTLKALEVLEH
jgi:hypothetical protein